MKPSSWLNLVPSGGGEGKGLLPVTWDTPVPGASPMVLAKWDEFKRERKGAGMFQACRQVGGSLAPRVAVGAELQPNQMTLQTQQSLRHRSVVY